MNPRPEDLSVTPFRRASVPALDERVAPNPTIHSQVAVAVNAALKAAGTEMPFPQRDLIPRFPLQMET